MRNIALATFAILILSVLTSSTSIDFTAGEYQISGTVYRGNTIVRDDSMYFVYSGPGIKPGKDNTKTIAIDSLGNYFLTVHWTGYCMSHRNMELYIEKSRRLNTDSLAFFYKGRWIRIENTWITALNLRHAGQTQYSVKRDLLF